MMRYQNNAADQQAVVLALNGWYTLARQHNVRPGAWLQLHPSGSLLYNCGGIQSPATGGYGVDYVDDGLYHWLEHNIPNGFTLSRDETWVGGGNQDGHGEWEYFQSYHVVTRGAGQWNNFQGIPAAGYQQGIPAGNYQVSLNFHLYVGDWQRNFRYTPPAPVQAPFNINDLNQFPALI